MNLARAIALASELDQRNYYEVLGVGAAASSDEIDNRYYLLAPRLHPDRFVRHATGEQLRALTRISARLTEARTALLSPRRRALYDQGLQRGQLRLQEEEEGVRLEEQRDPRTPLARKLHTTAIALAEVGKRRQALAKLQVAVGFEPESKVLAQMLATLEAQEAAHNAPASAPAAASPAPESSPAAASPAPETTPTARTDLAGARPHRASTSPPAEPLKARRHARTPLSTRVALKLGNWERFETLFTRNLSLGGVFVRTREMVPVGSAVAMVFALPDGTSVEVPGRVARCVEREGELGGIGVQFLEMPAATRAKIEALLAQVRRPSEAVAPPPAPVSRPASSAADPLGKELTLEIAVPELIRVRGLPPREALGLGGVELDRQVINAAYAQRSAPLGKSMLTTGEPNLIEAIVELTAHLMYARDRLLEDLGAADDPGADSNLDAAPAVIHDAAPAGAPALNTESSVAMEIRLPDETRPQRVPAGLISRPVLAPESLADLGRGGVAASSDPTLADRIFELIAEAHYEAAIELIAALVPNNAPRRLIAARHIARGYIAERDGQSDQATVEFESALLIDRTAYEAILRLRKNDS